MEAKMREFMAGIRMGPVRVYQNVAVIPLFGPGDNGFVYLALDEAMGRMEVMITEVSHSGHVPELKVINKAKQPVLILDGEELKGAKQNRVLNTTVLLKEDSESIIPVSCTEAGRWSYESHDFKPSGVVMAKKVRARKLRSVSSSLESEGRHRSNQGEVWHEIAELHDKLAVPSSTGAMHDAFEAKRFELEDAMKQFVLESGQCGLLAVINGEAAGFDWVSRPKAYEWLHKKLLQSYLIEALAPRNPVELSPQQAAEKAAAFLAEVTTCDQREFPSVGYGTDVRFRNHHVVGSALVHNGDVVHAAFLNLNDGSEMDERFMRRRRRTW